MKVRCTEASNGLFGGVPIIRIIEFGRLYRGPPQITLTDFLQLPRCSVYDVLLTELLQDSV